MGLFTGNSLLHAHIGKRFGKQSCHPNLRTVPTFVTAHLEILGFPMGSAY